MRLVRGLVVTVAIAGLVAACSSSGSPAPSPSSAGGGASQAPAAQATGGGASGATAADPCSLLTPAQISAVVGIPVGPGDSGGDTHLCDWSHPDANGVPDAQVSLSTNEDPGLCDEGSSTTLGITVTPVTGLGDQACMAQAAGLQIGDNLTFYKGGLGFSISANGKAANVADELAKDTALAHDVLSNLGL
ncbi:MAG: DUF3558 family protein [Candidatus Limnocylindrales bacterium]